MTQDANRELARRLAAHQLRLVLAESCTGGRAAALLTEIPGISQWFCGSAVTYRPSAKQNWLRVSEELLSRFTAESQEASDAMALGVLSVTSEADYGAAITGHLGPGAASRVDGLVFVSMAARIELDVRDRADPCREVRPPTIVYRASTRLKSATRSERQLEAAQWMLAEILAQLPPSESGSGTTYTG